MENFEIEAEIQLIKKEITEVKTILTSVKLYMEKYPIDRLLELEYLFRKFLIRIEQRLF